MAAGVAIAPIVRRECGPQWRAPTLDSLRVSLADAIAREIHRRGLENADLHRIVGGDLTEVRRMAARIKARLRANPGALHSEPGLSLLLRWAHRLRLDVDLNVRAPGERVLQ